MKLPIVVAIGLLATVTGCKSKTAFDYSEKIVKLERDLGPYIAKADEQMAKYLETQTYDSVISISSRMESLVGSKLDIIKNTQPPAVAEADNFKKAAIRFFNYMKSMYTAYKDFASQTEEEGKETARQRLISLAGQGEDEVKNMQLAQRKYAKANNFRIREDKNEGIRETKLKDKDAALKDAEAKLEEMKKAANDEKK